MSETKQALAELPRRRVKSLAEAENLDEALRTSEVLTVIKQSAPRMLNPDSMRRTWLAATQKQPLLLQCNMRQALGAFQSLAFLGLLPNTHLNHAHIIPFRTRRKVNNRWEDVVEPQIIIGYQGYIELAHRSAILKSLHADVVYNRELEKFSFSHGSNRHLHHEGLPPGPLPAGEPQYVYAYARLRDGEEQFEVLTWPEVLEVRDRSQAYRRALAALQEARNNGATKDPATWTDAPWVRDVVAMAKKTAVRRLMKLIPQSPEAQAAAALEEAQDRGSVDYGTVIDGKVNPLDTTPPVIEADPPPVAPDATYADRRPPPPPPPPKPPAQATAAPVPGFEAVLVDAIGEPDGEIFTDAVAWARAYASAWEKAPAGREALAEHNADTLLEAARDPKAAGILNSVTDLSQSGSQSDAPISPPDDRGKPNWAAYVRAFKEAANRAHPDLFPDWLNAQQSTLATVPMSHRPQLMAIIGQECQQRQLRPPPWIANLAIRPDDPDAQWVTRTVDMLRSLTDRADYDRLLQQPQVQTTMERLQREKPVLFQRADDAFRAKDEELARNADT
jgi:recombination protein RecT